MKWRDHKRITKYIAKAFGLSEENAKALAEASILPDVEPDFGVNVYVTKRGKLKVKEDRIQHHSEKAKEWAWKYLYKARREYLKKNSQWIEYLGKALHYLQDYTVSKNLTLLWVFKIKSWENHNKVESNLSRYKIPNEELMRVHNMNLHANMVKREIMNAKSKEKEDEVIREATYLTALAIKGVLHPTKPKDLERHFNKALKIHLALVSSPIALGIVLWALDKVNYAFVLVGFSIILHFLDFNFHYWNLERKWFYK